MAKEVEESEGEDEANWNYGVGCYHFLNLPQRKLYHLDKNTRTMWGGQYLSPDDSNASVPRKVG